MMTSNERGMNPSDSKGNVELAAIPKLTPRARPSARSVVTVPRGYIIASEKWKGTDLTRALQGQVKILYEEDLGVVDFHASSSMAVVYVSEADMISGGIGYRSKLVKLRMVPNTKGIVCVEQTAMTKQYVWAVQKFCVLDLGLTFLPVASQNAAADMLAALVSVESGRERNVFHRSGRLSGPFLDEDILTTVMTIPGLGEVKARLLLQHFHSLIDIAGASEKDISVVVGAAAAARIKTFFSSSS